MQVHSSWYSFTPCLYCMEVKKTPAAFLTPLICCKWLYIPLLFLRRMIVCHTSTCLANCMSGNWWLPKGKTHHTSLPRLLWIIQILKLQNDSTFHNQVKIAVFWDHKNWAIDINYDKRVSQVKPRELYCCIAHPQLPQCLVHLSDYLIAYYCSFFVTFAKVSYKDIVSPDTYVTEWIT